MSWSDAVHQQRKHFAILPITAKVGDLHMPHLSQRVLSSTAGSWPHPACDFAVFNHQSAEAVVAPSQ